MDLFDRFRKDESGGSASEYALTLAIVGAAVAFGSIALGSAISRMMNKTASCLWEFDRKCRDGVVVIPERPQKEPRIH